jgi:hypothetical protein
MPASLTDETRQKFHPPPWLAGRGAWRVVALLATLFALALTVPWQPAGEAPIGAFDFSWMLLLHDAVATGRQFGEQVILPQGPLGFLGTSVYDPRTYWILTAARSVIALVFLRALWQAGRRLVPQPLIALPWLLGITLLIGRSPDHFFPGCALLLLFTYFVVGERRLNSSVFALTLVLAAASLIKVNHVFYSIVALGTIGLDQMRTREWKKLAVLPLVYAMSVTLFYLCARQKPSSVPAFLWGWKEVTFGHADAVGLPGLWLDAASYLLVVAGVVMLVAILFWKRSRLAGAIPTLGTAGVLLLLYKHSFMRSDIHHVHMGPMVATAAAAMFLPAIWHAGSGGWRVAGAVVLALAAMIAFSIHSSYTGENFLSVSVRRCAYNVRAVADTPRLRREWLAARQKLRDDNPLTLSAIQPPVDVYPHRQDVVFAYDLPYAPRPVVSSLVATSPTLAALNARHLREPDAAQTVLFDVELVDQNFPTMLDGASLPGLLSRYEVADASGAMLVLRRRPIRRGYRLAPLSSRSTAFDQDISIPAVTDAPIWANVHIKHRALGRVLGALYKPAMVGIEVRTADGQTHGYRLLPSLADEQGFLLSPLIEDRGAFAKLASGGWSSSLARQAVMSLKVFVVDDSADKWFEPQVDIELKRLEIQR